MKAKNDKPPEISKQELIENMKKWDFQFEPVRVRGKIKRITVITDRMTMRAPGPEEEIAQLIRITRDGRVSFASYLSETEFGMLNQNVSPSKAETFQIEPDKAESIMTDLEKRFPMVNPFDQYTDVGDWYLTVTNEDDEEFNIHGSLFMQREEVMSELSSLSDLIREELNRPNLFLFDGKVKD